MEIGVEFAALKSTANSKSKPTEIVRPPVLVILKGKAGNPRLKARFDPVPAVVSRCSRISTSAVCSSPLESRLKSVTWTELAVLALLAALLSPPKRFRLLGPKTLKSSFCKSLALAPSMLKLVSSL